MTVIDGYLSWVGGRPLLVSSSTLVSEAKRNTNFLSLEDGRCWYIVQLRSPRATDVRRVLHVLIRYKFKCEGIYALCPHQYRLSAKVRVFIDYFLATLRNGG